MIDINDMFSCGVHYGHRSCFANPKMAEYVFSQKNDLQIIDLRKTEAMLQAALVFIEQLARSGGKIVIVGTKQAAQNLVAEKGKEMNMPYVDQRWLGGMLTNFKTVRASVGRLGQLNKRFEAGDLKGLTKKERLILQRERAKLSVSLGGVMDLDSLPEALFVIDVSQERIAIQEANKLGIPVIGVVDTNGSPEGVDYVIPGNDDALSAIEYYLSCVAAVVGRAQAELQAEREKIQKQARPQITKKAVKKEAPKDEKVAEKEESGEAEAEAAPKKKVVKRVVKKADETADETADVAKEPKKVAKKVVKKVVKKDDEAKPAKATVKKKAAASKATADKPAKKATKKSSTKE